MNSFFRALGRCGISGRGLAMQDGLWVVRTASPVHARLQCRMALEKKAGTDPVQRERSGSRAGASLRASRIGEAITFGRSKAARCETVSASLSTF